MDEKTETAAESWYGAGVRFECTRCGRCCGGSSGTVLVSDAEIVALARRLELSPDEFRAGYTRRLRGGDLSLRERRNYDCVLYEPGVGCSVYEDRPRQCRTYPFWRGNPHSKESWEEEATHCPGIGEGGLWGDERLPPLLADDGIRTDR